MRLQLYHAQRGNVKMSEIQPRTTQAKRKQKKFRRLPNGYGSVHKINDGRNRRKPWRARVLSHVEFDEMKGKATQKYITVGYFETESEALDALLGYRKSPYTLEASTCTFAELFEMWKEKKYPEISKSGQGRYNAAFKHSASLHNMKMRDIRTLHLDTIMQNLTAGHQTQTALKILWGQLFKYAIEHDIVQKNYADFVKIKDKTPETGRTAIPPEDIATLWRAIDSGNEWAEMAMIYIYTGFRLNELLEIRIENVNLETRIMIGGKKTKAGKDRRVPIHKCILPFIEKRMQNNTEWLFIMPKKSRKADQRLTPTVFNSNFALLLKQYNLNEEYTAHYMRHTFATIARQAGIEEDIRKLILGHSSKDVTDRYTHFSDEMLIEAMDSIPGRE